jgi:hypothetical protein
MKLSLADLTRKRVIDLNASSIDYFRSTLPTILTVQEGLDYLLRVAPTIASFSGGSNNEKGQTITTVTAVWTLSGDLPIYSTLTDVSNFDIISEGGTHSYTGLTLTDKTYTLTIGDNTLNPSSTASTTVHFTQYFRYGNSSSTTLTSGQILALPNEVLTDYRQRTILIDGSGNYLYFAYPVSYGAVASIWVSGLQDTSWIQNTVSYTNASGYTENYYTYRSLYTQAGTGIPVEIR